MRKAGKIEDKETFWKHYETIKKYSDELIEAEETVRRIRATKDFKEAYTYFAVNKMRGLIKDYPKSENNYALVTNDGKVYR